MIQKFTVCLMICFACFLVGSFSEEALSPPPESSRAVFKTEGAAESNFAFVSTNEGFRDAAKNEYAHTVLLNHSSERMIA